MSGCAIWRVLPKSEGLPITLYMVLGRSISLIHLRPWNHTRVMEPVPSEKVASRRDVRPEMMVWRLPMRPRKTR